MTTADRRFGDGAIAGVLHDVDRWSAQRPPSAMTQTEVLAAYSAIPGYSPERIPKLTDLCLCGHVLDVHPGQYGDCRKCSCAMYRPKGA